MARVMRRAAAAALCLGLGTADAQERYGAPEGALFAWVPLPGFDRKGQPVKRAETGEPVQDGFCLYWKPGWLTRNERVPITAGQVWWTAVSYSVNPNAHEITVNRVWGPDVEALPEGGWRRVSGGQNGYQGKGVSAPMFETPLEDWPCKPRTWATVVASERRIAPSRPAVGYGGRGGGGGFSFPQPSIVNPCMYTNGHVVPNCHR
jgi:hypothetical protein